jgi:hypothetical protein
VQQFLSGFYFHGRIICATSRPEQG